MDFGAIGLLRGEDLSRYGKLPGGSVIEQSHLFTMQCSICKESQPLALGRKKANKTSRIMLECWRCGESEGAVVIGPHVKGTVKGPRVEYKNTMSSVDGDS